MNECQMIGRKLMMAQKIRRLPDAYQEVEWLKGTGTQYIDLQHAFTSQIEYEMVFSFPTMEFVSFFGSSWAGSTTVNRNEIEIWNYNLAIYIGKKTVRTSAAIDTLYTVNVSKNKVSVNGAETQIDGDFEGSLYNDFLFAFNREIGEGTRADGTAMIYSFHAKDDEYEINLIPCYRKSDSKPGMYDTVSDTFFVNDGTGEFEVGGDV